MMPSDINHWVVLMVDDQPDNLVPTRRLLTGLGATVHLAKDGLHALETLTALRPTIILADLSMPTMDGWEMIKHIRANPDTRTIRVIAVTAHALPADRKRALEAGFDGYITKPFRPSLLINEIRRLTAPIPPTLEMESNQ